MDIYIYIYIHIYMIIWIRYNNIYLSIDSNRIPLSTILPIFIQGLYLLSGRTSYRKISWSLEAARFGIKLFQSLWNLAGTSAALLPRCLSNFRAMRPLQHPISRLRDFTRFGGKTSYRLVNRGPGLLHCHWTNPIIISMGNVDQQPLLGLLYRYTVVTIDF